MTLRLGVSYRQRCTAVATLALTAALAFVFPGGSGMAHAQSRPQANPPRPAPSVGMGGFVALVNEAAGPGVSLNLDLSQPLRFEVGRFWIRSREDNDFDVRYAGVALRFWHSQPPGSSCAKYVHGGAGIYQYQIPNSGYSSNPVSGINLSGSLECVIGPVATESFMGARFVGQRQHERFSTPLIDLEFGLRLRLRF